MNTTKRSGATTVNNGTEKRVAYSPRRYATLLAKVLPAVIESQAEYDRLESIFARLIDKGESKHSPEEAKVFALVAKLLEEFENTTLPVEPELGPSETLRFLMDENDLRQSDLVGIFGSQSAVSRALSGSRRIGIEHAKQLASRFKVSAELFL